MHAIDLMVVVFLVLLNGFFAMAELAIVSSRTSGLRQLAADGGWGAQEALALTVDPTRFLATVQIGMTLVAILNGAFTDAAFGDPIETWLSLSSGISLRQDLRDRYCRHRSRLPDAGCRRTRPQADRAEISGNNRLPACTTTHPCDQSHRPIGVVS